MTRGTIWLAIFAIAILTLALRLSFIHLFGRMNIPPLLQRALRFVPAAVLPALVLPALLIRSDTLDISLGNDRLIAGFIAMVVAWRSKNVFLTILTGMICLWILQAIG